MFIKLPSLLLLAGVSSAHFVLKWPYTAGFDDDNEPNAPCGGASVIVNSTSPQVNVDRFAVSITVTHPTGNFGFYVSTDTQAPYTFTKINQNVSSSGIGTFCENYLSVPSSYAGKAGILQVIDSSIDGVLYQCAPVNFVSGSNNTLGAQCSNATGQSLTWTGPAAAVVSSNSSSSSTTTSSAAATAATTTSTRSGLAAMVTLGAAPLLGGLGAVAAGLIL